MIKAEQKENEEQKSLNQAQGRQLAAQQQLLLGLVQRVALVEQFSPQRLVTGARKSQPPISANLR